jgi:hypothetical protein
MKYFAPNPNYEKQSPFSFSFVRNLIHHFLWSESHVKTCWSSTSRASEENSRKSISKTFCAWSPKELGCFRKPLVLLPAIGKTTHNKT